METSLEDIWKLLWKTFGNFSRRHMETSLEVRGSINEATVGFIKKL